MTLQESGNNEMTENITTIPQMFVKRASIAPDKVALRYKYLGIWRDVTWDDYVRNARRTCLGLISLGLRRGDRVSVIGENRPEWLYSDLGTMCAGGVTVGIYTTSSAEQCEYVVGHSQSRIYIAEDEEQLDKALFFRERTPDLERIVVMDSKGLRQFSDPMVITFDELIELGKQEESRHPNLFDELLQQTDPQEMALIIYTSGTTGPPKGAMLSHTNVNWTSWSIGQALEIHESDELLSFLPLSHIAERMFSVFLPLRFGYTVSFTESPDTIMANFREISPTVVFAVPRIWEKYYSGIRIRIANATWFKKVVYSLATKISNEYAGRCFSGQKVPVSLKLLQALANVLVLYKLRERLGFERVQLAVSGAAPISPDVIKYFHGLGIPLREVYGQTEGTGPTCIHQGDNIELGNVGPALPGVEVKIDEDGEILVKGDNVFMGYYRNPEATQETLVDGWLRSGDVGKLDERGFLKITDRKKDLIITAGGKNIAPQNIENQLKFSPYVNDAIVIGDRLKFLSALIVLDEENVVQYAQDHKISFTTYESLTIAPEIIELIDMEVQQVNKTLSHVETIKKFKIVPKKLYEEDGEVTPTMKVKRKYINEKFADLIKAMYKS
ncbi:MAG: long-chain acyl-CoA synthetase [Thermodesulfobacteriota bacterium]|nr:long-chain acyl-CoA synthetase [Thermodesulfobacteriota bacterium]